jgi:hypothetical protein
MKMLRTCDKCKLHIATTAATAPNLSKWCGCEVDALRKALSAWVEYFGAIKDGEYDNNRRPQPLRSYEEVLLLKSRRALGKDKK